MSASAEALMVLVKFKVSAAVQHDGDKAPTIYAFGQVVELSASQAKGLLAAGHCEETSYKDIEEATETVDGVETAVTRRRRRA